ncbi:MAG: hypothetical protein LBJ81_01685 [Puniceicoccales bacterium]|jgi:hypothetical protein|nr:hypothetical protein [Puniceicoccales bacterium]
MKLLSGPSKILLLAAAMGLGGCMEEDICNMTPNVMPQNQSHMYTITMGVRNSDGDILQKTIKPYVVIDGEKHGMQKHPDGNNIFVYDCPFPDLGTIPYYFELIYEINRHGTIREKIAKSELYHTTITNKYIFALDANRGPVGAPVNIVGCGLGRADRVRVGGRMVASEWLSAGAVEFRVPPMDCDREYEVYLLSGRKEFFAGTLFIDRSNLQCSSDFIRLNSGESQRLVFMIDQAAPADGIELAVTTDIPNSIIMPEVRFSAGERTASVNIRGSEEAGEGTLFVGAKGFRPLEIPVEVGDIAVAGGEFPENDRGLYARPLRAAEPVDDDIVVL